MEENIKVSIQSGVETLPLVTIVTPAFNAMPYLKETIESVLAQNYPNLEHIVMDGGSQDGTVELLKSYPHLVWASEPDRGQSHALNKAFSQASGEIIGWLNADDTYQPDAVHTAVAYLMEHPEADLVHSDLRIIDEKSQQIGFTKAKPYDLTEILTSNMIKQPTVFMRRAVLNKLKGVNEEYHYVMDREMWLRAGRHFRFAYLSQVVLANFRMIPGTKTFNNAVGFHEEWLKVLNLIIQNPEAVDICEKIKKNAYRLTKSQYHFAHMQVALDKNNKFELGRQLVSAIYFNWRLCFNRGTWRIVVQRILGIKPDKVRKYRKLNHV